MAACPPSVQALWLGRYMCLSNSFPLPFLWPWTLQQQGMNNPSSSSLMSYLGDAQVNSTISNVKSFLIQSVHNYKIYLYKARKCKVAPAQQPCERNNKWDGKTILKGTLNWDWWKQYSSKKVHSFWLHPWDLSVWRISDYMNQALGSREI